MDEATAYGGRYRRLFPELPGLEGDEAERQALGVPGGFCDCGPDERADEGREAAGWPLFGQFVAHDITSDRSSPSHHADVEAIRNFRTPKPTLECLDADGPTGRPSLCDADDPAKLLLDGHDLPRNRQGTALAGDQRQDVHLFVNQLQVALARVHNGLVDRLREDGVAEADLFEQARRSTQWHYQWAIVEDFLPRVAGEEIVGSVRREGPRFYHPAPGDPYIPFEFADAAYRYGHSQIRRSYRVNGKGEPRPVFPDYAGFRPVPAEHAVDWRYLFDLPGAAPAQRSKRIDGTLPPALIALPEAVTGQVDVAAFHSLAARDLQRGQALGLPAGEDGSRAMGEEPLSPDEVALGEAWSGPTPLWLYVMREAYVRCDGNRLGPVGGRIVAEVLLGIVDADPASYRSVDPSWRPTLPAVQNGPLGLADLLLFSGRA